MKPTIIIAVLINCIMAAQVPDTTKDKPVQYRRGIELQEGYQTYEEKYSGKDLEEIKRSLFPLRSTGVWTELNPKVPRVNYFGINFVNKDTGWACGANGALIKTNNGGNSWKTINSQTTSPILKVKSYNSQIVIASGYDGLILRSIDGGETFTQVGSGVTGDLWGLQMLNDTLGWACGNRNSLIKTTDNGLTWQILLTPGYTSDYWCIDFLNESYGFIAANGKVLKTTDGGNNWEIIQAGDTRSLYTIDAIDSLHIVAAGGPFGKNVYSSDGGFTWIQNANLIYENGVNNISFINADTGYAVGENWAIRKTENRGVTWWASAPVYSDWGLNLLEGGVGYASGGALRVYKTSNGYDNWKKLFIADNFSDVFFVNEQKGFAISPTYEDGKLYSTSNSGINWEVVSGAPGGNDILFIDNQTGFIGGSNLFKTTDGGESWYQVNGVSGGVGKIFFINQTTGWATSGGRILKTTDSGENWVVQHQTNVVLTSIYFIDTLYGWTANINGRPFKTTDGGMNWVQQTNLDIWESDDVYFYDYLKGWIISGNKLYYTTNAGINWSLDPQIYTYTWKFETLSDSHFIITGTNIYESKDQGITWLNVTNQIGSGFSSLSAPKNYIAYGVGNLGFIVKYLDTLIIPVELISFTVEQVNNQILISWITATETNNYGFEIWCSSNLRKWEKIGFVSGSGTVTEKKNYSYIDNQVSSEYLYYRLKQIDFDGKFYFSEIISTKNPINNFILNQNYPNPANPNTNISFAIPIKSNVKICLYSLTGELVKEILNEEKEKGIYNIEINLNTYASGMYFYRITTKSGFTATKKLILLK